MAAMRWTIRRKLMLSISIPLLITYLLVLGWDYYRQRAIVTTFMQDLMLTRARLMVNAINAKLEQAQDLARATANAAAGNVMTVQGDAGQSVRVAIMPKADWVVAGLVAMRSPAAPGTPAGPVRMMVVHGAPGEDRPPVQKELTLAGDETWFTTVMRTGQAGWFGPMSQPGIVNGEVVMYATPVRVQDRVIGVGAVLVSPEAFRQVSQANYRLLPSPTASTTKPIDVASLIGGSFDDFVVVSPNGQVICRPLAVDAFQAMFRNPKLRDSAMAGAFLKAAAGEADVVLAQGLPANAEEENYWATFCPIPATGWVFSAVVPESAVMRPVLLLMAQRAALLLAGLVLMLCIVYFVSVRTSGPIERLAMAQRRVGQGDLQTQASGTRGTDEVAELARGFNAMVGQIRQQMEDIRIAAAAQEKVEGELRIARAIQADLLPRKFPAFPGRAEFDLHAVNVPARYVAGDFYDFFLTDDRHLMLVIADVSGKGVPAALLMAVTRTIVRNLALAGKSPLEIIRQVNRMLVQDSPENMFVTMIVAEYDTGTGTLRYVNAGHPAPILTTPDGTRMVGESTAPLVGADDDWPEEAWQDATLTIMPGAALTMYTDGLTEARNPQGELLGDERTIEIAQGCAGQSAMGICQGIVNAVECYEGKDRNDDLTLLVLRRLI